MKAILENQSGQSVQNGEVCFTALFRFSALPYSFLRCCKKMEQKYSGDIRCSLERHYRFGCRCLVSVSSSRLDNT